MFIINVIKSKKMQFPNVMLLCGIAYLIYFIYLSKITRWHIERNNFFITKVELIYRSTGHSVGGINKLIMGYWFQGAGYTMLVSILVVIFVFYFVNFFKEMNKLDNY